MKFFLLIALLLNARAWGQVRDFPDIPTEFYGHYENGEHQVMSIDDGSAALQIRLDLIKSAKKTIELESYIFNMDMSGKLVTRELINAAVLRKVKVRILVDALGPVKKMTNHLVKELNQYGIDVRFYNQVNMILRPVKVQLRNHRKLLIIDDEVAITGGRNIGDDYFDLSDQFNFNDRDILVRGPVVEKMRKTFDLFFNSKVTTIPELPELPRKIRIFKRKSYTKFTNEAQEFLEETQEELETRKLVESIARPILDNSKLHTCPELTFATDRPGAGTIQRFTPGYSKRYRHLSKVVYSRMALTDKRLIIASPYVLFNGESRAIVEELLNKQIPISFYSNSLSSTDAIFMAANFYHVAFEWLSKGMRFFLHSGEYAGSNNKLNSDVTDAKWGTHEKVHIYEYLDGKSEVMIGSMNMDNRSDNFNTEIGIFCKGSDEFTKEVKQSLLRRVSKGITLHQNKTATTVTGKRMSVYGSTGEHLAKMKSLFIPAWLIKWLL